MYILSKFSSTYSLSESPQPSSGNILFKFPSNVGLQSRSHCQENFSLPLLLPDNLRIIDTPIGSRSDVFEWMEMQLITAMFYTYWKYETIIFIAVCDIDEDMNEE